MRVLLSWVGVALLSSGAARADSNNAHLALAERLASELKFQEAVGELDQAWLVKDNARPTVLRILELQGIAAGSLRKGKKAEGYFRQLLVLDPTRTLSSDYAPRVLTPFYEAKNWVGDHSPLRFAGGKATQDGAGIHAIRVSLQSDSFSFARKVRFHFRANAGTWNTSDAPLDASGQAQVRIEGKTVEWWAELLGERDAQFALVGSATAPVLEQLPPPPPPPVASAPVSAGPAGGSGSTELRAQVSGAPENYRPLSYGLMLGGVAAAGFGTYFGLHANHEMTLSNNAVLQSYASMHADNANKAALAANVLLGTAAALGVGGALTWWLAPHGSDTVLAFGPGGVTVTGSF